MSSKLLAFIGLALLGLSSCRTLQTTVKPPVEVPPLEVTLPTTALIRLDAASLPRFDDAGSIESLRRSARESAGYFRRLSPQTAYRLGHDTYTAVDMAETAELLASVAGTEGWLDIIASSFTIYQSVGKDADRTVVFSSYYEPEIEARLIRDAVYRYPLYGRPNDLIDVDLGLFNPAWAGMRTAGRREGTKLVPYPVREQMDSKGILRDQGIEIAWAKDPLDIFFLQIEGSGWLNLGKGERVRIRFDGHNGRPYTSVGQQMIQRGLVKKEEFNHAAMVEYMKRHPERRASLLNLNERYVFFKLDRSPAAVDAIGNIGVPLTPGRSMATDPKLFPKGALGYIVVDPAPQGPFSQNGKISRFILNQDEGGAIQGPHRVDFFVGHGPEEEKFAFQLWHPGKLYFLVKKRS